MHVIYRITYLPHLRNNTFPFYYIGSKCNYNSKRNYLGSLSSVQQTWYSEGMEAGKWWAKQKKDHPENFLFEILEECNDSLSAKDMTLIERTYHDALDVLSDLYFNFSKATRGFCGCKRSPESKALIARKTKEFWNGPSGEARKIELSKRNSLIKSQELTEKWKDPAFIEKMNLRKAPKRTDEHKRMLSETKKLYWANGGTGKIARQVSIDGVIYNNVTEAAASVNMSKGGVRKRIASPKHNWNYT